MGGVLFVGCASKPKNTFFVVQTEESIRSAERSSEQAEQAVIRLRESSTELDTLLNQIRSYGSKIDGTKRLCDRPLKYSIRK